MPAFTPNGGSLAEAGTDEAGAAASVVTGSH